MKTGDKYPLQCGHLGSVVGVYGDTIAVKGYLRHRCDGCSKRNGNTYDRKNTVYIIDLSFNGA